MMFPWLDLAQQQRFFLSRNQGQHIAGDAAGLAKSAIGKLGRTLSDTVTALVPQRREDPVPRAPPQQRYGRGSNEYGRMYPW